MIAVPSASLVYRCWEVQPRRVLPSVGGVHSGFAATGCVFSFGDVDCRGGVRRTRIKDGLTRRFRILPLAAALCRCPAEITSLVKTTLGDAFVLARSAQEARRGGVGREKMLMALACGNLPIGVSRCRHSATGGCAVTLFFELPVRVGKACRLVGSGRSAVAVMRPQQAGDLRRRRSSAVAKR